MESRRAPEQIWLVARLATIGARAGRQSLRQIILVRSRQGLWRHIMHNLAGLPHFSASPDSTEASPQLRHRRAYPACFTCGGSWLTRVASLARDSTLYRAAPATRRASPPVHRFQLARLRQ